MMAWGNRVSLLGHIGHPSPTLTYARNGAPHTTFVLAITEPNTFGRPLTTFVQIEVWGAKAAAASAFVPGQLAAIEAKSRSAR